jgi:L-asparaginase
VEDILNNYGIPVVQSMQTNSGEMPLSDVSSQSAAHIASGYLDLRTPGSWSACILLKEKNMAEIAITFTGSVDDCVTLLSNLEHHRQWIILCTQ